MECPLYIGGPKIASFFNKNVDIFFETSKENKGLGGFTYQKMVFICWFLVSADILQ